MQSLTAVLCKFVDFDFAENEIWICKPTGKNQGKGIFLVRSLLDLHQIDAENEETNPQQMKGKRTKKPMGHIIQRSVNDLHSLHAENIEVKYDCAWRF